MSCARVKDAFGLHFPPFETGCCESCHQDDEMGMGPMAVFIAGDCKHEIEVCCEVQRALASKGVTTYEQIAEKLR